MDDLRALREINGVTMLPAVRTKGSDRMLRHGDSAIAAALAWYASSGEITEYDYTPAKIPGRTTPADRWRMRMTDDDDEFRDDAWSKGAW